MELKQFPFWIVLASIGLLAGCSKDLPGNQDGNPSDDGFTTYLIRQGQQYCDQNTIKLLTTSGMTFLVRFDSSAIYQTNDPQNQYDINKLWGFSEGYNHQYNSARFGWRWSDNALRLFGYVYNAGTRISREISAIPIDSTIHCSVMIRDSLYDFTVNDSIISLPRTATGVNASGYQLYPYFGGDETAPQNISIKIKEL
jgi:cytochrome c biogenesis protein ResB